MHSNSNVSSGWGGSAADRPRQVIVGVDIGGTKTAVSVSAALPTILWREEFPTKPEDGPEPAIRNIEALIQRGLTETHGELLSIGISCGGPLDSQQGLIQQPPNLLTWVDVPVVKTLQAMFQVPCYLENDANAGALAEYRFGAGLGCQHMIFLTMGTGLGAGLILNGQLYRGATSMAGEIGHVRLTRTGPTGYGKIGSVEGWASGAGMAQHGAAVLRDALASGKQSLLAEKLDTLTSRDIGAALEDGDEIAAKIVKQTGVRLGEALAILVDILNPQRIVIGGLALRFGEHLLAPARKVLREASLASTGNACTVVPAALGEQIGDVAALCLATGSHVAS